MDVVNFCLENISKVIDIYFRIIVKLYWGPNSLFDDWWSL